MKSYKLRILFQQNIFLKKKGGELRLKPLNKRIKVERKDFQIVKEVDGREKVVHIPTGITSIAYDREGDAERVIEGVLSGQDTSFLFELEDYTNNMK